jgi:1-acyl-sn-glycerol-3-phosphate acyltransferase
MMLFLRSFVFNAVMFGTCFVISAWLRLTASRKTAVYNLSKGQLWARITLRALKLFCRIGVTLCGAEFLPPDGPALIAAQHQSAFDTVFWLTALPRPAYVLKQELLRIPIFGPLLSASGFIAVDRDGGARSLRKMVVECRAAIAQGRQIVIFPEGTRVPAGERGSIQPGILALARALNLPVIPASTDSGLYWGRKSFHKHPGTVTVTLHAPITETAGSRDLLDELARIYYVESVDNSVSYCEAEFGHKIDQVQ